MRNYVHIEVELCVTMYILKLRLVVGDAGLGLKSNSTVGPAAGAKSTADNIVLVAMKMSSKSWVETPVVPKSCWSIEV